MTLASGGGDDCMRGLLRFGRGGEASGPSVAAIRFDAAGYAYQGEPEPGKPMQWEGDRFHIDGFDPEDPRHDAEFPHDPVARARRVLIIWRGHSASRPGTSGSRGSPCREETPDSRRGAL